MSVWQNKTFRFCSFRKCISNLRQALVSIKLPETRINGRNSCFKVLKRD